MLKCNTRILTLLPEKYLSSTELRLTSYTFAKLRENERMCNVKYVPLTRGDFMSLLTYLEIICKSFNISKLDSIGIDVIIEIKETE